MSQPLGIYTFCPRKRTVSWDYRCITPLETARDLGLNVRSVIDTDDAGISPQQHIEAFCEADVCLLYQPTGDAAVHNARQAKSLLPSLRDGEWKHPPTIIVDSDDNLFHVNPHNNAFRTLGIRDPEGNDIPPGQMIGEVNDVGERRMLWHDGPCDPKQCGGEGTARRCERYVDFARNHQTLNSYRQMLEIADAFTSTNPNIVEAVEREAQVARSRVFPNLIRFDHYPQLDLVQDEKQVRILWQGGGAHWEDWFPLKAAVLEITKRYPEVHWIIWGALYPWVMEQMPPDRYTWQPWCKPDEYKLRRVMVNDDINLAPLVDNRFNRCRSAIKWYEGCVSKKPAATVAQNTGAYAAEIQHGQSGLLFNTPNEFVNCVSTLIENPKQRRELADNAVYWVRKYRDAIKHVPAWVKWLEDLRAETIREQPHMPESEWAGFVKQFEESENGVAV